MHQQLCITLEREGILRILYSLLLIQIKLAMVKGRFQDLVLNCGWCQQPLVNGKRQQKVCQVYQVCQHKEDTIEASMSTPGKASLLTTATNVLPKFCGNVDLSQ